jgi:uncharacterized protein
MSSANFSSVALFPLPNVVLFPRAVLPLHIFEQRYKIMTADVLAGDRQIAMALLRPGWEKLYHAKPQIEPIVCVGTILTHEQLADGTYNFLLQGRTRAKIVHELSDVEHPYRVAKLEPLTETHGMEIDLQEQRARLRELFNAGVFAGTGLGEQFRKLLEAALPVTEVADLIAFNYFEDVLLKQSLLAESDVQRRVARTIAELEALGRSVKPPRSGFAPPSVN